MTRLKPLLGAALSLGLLALSFVVLNALSREYHWQDVLSHLRALPALTVVAALALTVLNYALLTAYDRLSLRYVGAQLSYGRSAFAAFVGYTFSNTLGFALLTGSSVRYRLYSNWGLNTAQIARLVLFSSLTFFLGLCVVGGLSLSFALPPLPPKLALPGWLAPALGSLGIVSTVVGLLYISLPLWRKTPLRLRERELAIPTLRLTLSQLLLATLDWMTAAAVFYVLLPSHDSLSYWQVLSIFVAANLLGVLAHVPGGLGVFESVVTVLLSPYLPLPAIFGALLAYRIIYYFLPFLLALLSFAGLELLRHRRWLPRLTAGVQDSLRALVPPLVSLGVFIAGALLLFSGATPTVHERLRFLRALVPLELLEASHFFSSLVGMALLLLARSLQRRYDAAFTATLGLLGAGIVLSLLKGLDWEEASVLTLVLAAMLPCRSLFYRRGSLLNTPLSASWLAAIAAVLLGAAWLVFFSYRHVEYSEDLWTQFAFRADASRALRAGVGVASLAALLGLAHLLRPGRVRPAPASAQDLDEALNLAQRVPSGHGNLALAGDKYLLFNEARSAFLMYGIEGRSWVVLGDPIGPLAEANELLWQFRELCDRYDAWPVFYQVRATLLPLYLDLGLAPLKLGEEAMVPLADFSLEGSANKSLRQSHAKAQREGLRFELIAAQAVAARLPALKAISDAWLTEKNVREKGFSVGVFSEDYLRRFPLALVFRDETLVGFANVWTSELKAELSVDLMRYHPDAPGGVMDFLMTELMLWGKAQGYAAFNLGMAPMSGLVEHPLAPLWTKLGQALYAHGTRFYNFHGLRQYKEKYRPSWESRYLISPGGLVLPRILANVTALISRGMLGSVRK